MKDEGENEKPRMKISDELVDGKEFKICLKSHHTIKDKYFSQMLMQRSCINSVIHLHVDLTVHTFFLFSYAQQSLTLFFHICY